MEGRFVDGFVDGNAVLRWGEVKIESYFEYGAAKGEGKGKDREVEIEGNFNNNLVEGEAILKARDGSWRYLGEVKDSQMHGKGKLQFEDGRLFEGYFRNGLKEGKGIMKDPNEEFEYHGDWKKDTLFWKVKVLKGKEQVESIKYFLHGNQAVKGKLQGKKPKLFEYEGDVADGKPFGFGVYKCDDYIYKGEIKFGVIHGQGEIKHLKKKYRFKGSFKEGKEEGHSGVMTIEGVGTYRGTFKNGQIHGDGVFESEDGSTTFEGKWSKGHYESGTLKQFEEIYSGEFSEDKYHGDGKLRFANGDIYKGKFSGGKASGSGKMTYVQEGKKIEGSFKNGKPNGNCIVYMGEDKFRGYMKNGQFGTNDIIIEYGSGGKYNGQLKDFKRHGKGKMIYPDNSYYEGEWEDDVYDGIGTYHDPEGKADETTYWTHGKPAIIQSLETKFGHWSGTTEENNPQGFGKMKYKEGHPQYKEYDGLWGKNGPQGLNGRMVYADGHVYIGGWESGKRHGKGTLYFKNQKAYDGDWENDKRNGHGHSFGVMENEVTKKDESFSYKGGFLDDRFHGDGELKFKDTKLKGHWVKGLKHGKIDRYEHGKHLEDQTKFYYLGEVCKHDRIIEKKYEYSGDLAPNGQPHGKGVYTYLSRTEDDTRQKSKIYEGEFFEGKKHGNGQMRYMTKIAIGKRKQKNNANKVSDVELHKELTNLPMGFEIKRRAFNLGTSSNRNIRDTIQDDNISVASEISNLDVSYESVPSVMELVDGSERGTAINSAVGSRPQSGHASSKRSRRRPGDIVYRYEDSVALIITGKWFEDKMKGKGKIEKPKGSSEIRSTIVDSYIIYDGDFSNDTKNGNGKYLFLDSQNFGNVYIGDFLNNSIQGKGTMKYQNGDVYNGEWIKGKRQGYGEFKKKNGVLYKGTWKSGDIKEGSMVDKIKNRSYKGSFDKFKFHGEGELIQTQDNGGREIYKGCFRIGKYNGQGSIKYPNGDKYEGEFLNGRRNGHGRMVYKDGKEYEGSWSDGKRNGHGKMNWNNGDIYEGNWLNGRMHQFGEYKVKGMYTYKGEIVKGMLEGKGTLNFDGGIKFTGIFDDDLPTEFASLNLISENKIKSGSMAGVFKLGQVRFSSDWNLIFAEVKFTKSGDIYRGDFKNQAFNGVGEYTWNDEKGTTYTGGFLDGSPHGAGKVFYRKSDKKGPSGDWNAGKLVNETGVIVERSESDEDSDSDLYMEISLPQLFTINDEHEIIYENEKVAIEDISSVISIEVAFKCKYIENIDDYNYYRTFCDALEIENLLKTRKDLVVRALEDFSLREMLIDPIRTGSRSQRFFLIDIIMDLNFGYLIFFEGVRSVTFDPFERILTRAVNKINYVATKTDIVNQLLVTILAVLNETTVNSSGYLIFDEIFLVLIQTGVLEFEELVKILKELTIIYEDMLLGERNYSKENSDSDIIKTRYKCYANRRVVLGRILLQIILQVYDFYVLNENKSAFKNYYPKQSFEEFQLSFSLNIKDITAMAKSLFEDYVTKEIYSIFGYSFRTYLENNTNYSEICLSFTYMLIKLEEKNFECEWKEEFKAKFEIKPHVLSDIFVEARRKCRNNIFNFGLFMKESLDNVNFEKIFDGRVLGIINNVSSTGMSYQLLPSFIINYCSDKKLEQKHIDIILEDPFSTYQLNSQGSTTVKYVEWLLNNDREKESFDSHVNRHTLLSIDFEELSLLVSKGDRGIPVIKLFNSLAAIVHKTTNDINGTKISINQLKMIRINDILEISKVKSKMVAYSMDDIPSIPLWKDYERIKQMDETELNFIRIIMEFQFEYIIYPKFMMRNCCFFNIEIEKFNALGLYLHDIILDPLQNGWLRKSILHALIIGYTIDFENDPIEEMTLYLDSFIDCFDPQATDDEYSQDFVYLISFICAKVWFRDKNALSIGAQANDALEEKDEQVVDFIHLVIARIRRDTIADKIVSNEPIKIQKKRNSNMNNLTINIFKGKMNQILSKGIKTIFEQSTKEQEKDQRQWESICTIFEKFSSLVEDAKKRVVFDVESTLKEHRAIWEGKSSKFSFSHTFSEKMTKVLVREFITCFSKTDLDEITYMRRIVNHEDMLYKLSGLIKRLLESDIIVQKVIVEEFSAKNLEENTNSTEGVEYKKIRSGELFKMILQICSLDKGTGGKKKHKITVFDSSYYESYGDYWVLRYILMKMMTSVAENNCMKGKQLFHDLEGKNISLIKAYLHDIKDQLTDNEKMSEKDLIFQQWKFELLQELNVGPFPDNQKTMTNIEFMNIYYFKHIKRSIPRRLDHPRFKRDRSLLRFFISVLEGGNPSIMEKMRLQIKPEEIVSYIDILLPYLIIFMTESTSGYELVDKKEAKENLSNLSKKEIARKKRRRKTTGSKLKQNSSIGKFDSSMIESSFASGKTFSDGREDETDKFFRSEYFKNISKRIKHDSFKERLLSMREGDSPIYDIILYCFYCLFLIIPDIDPFERSKLKSYFAGTMNESLLLIFLKHLRSVEISNSSQKSEIVVFPAMNYSKELNEELRVELMEDFDPQNPTSLANSILLEFENTMKMLDTKLRYRKKFGFFYLMTSESNLSTAKLFIMILSFIINGVILLDGQAGDMKTKFKSETKIIIYTLTGIIFFVSMAFLLLVTALKLPVFIIRATEKDGTIWFSDIVRDYVRVSTNFLLHAIFCGCSIFFSTYYYTVHLILVITLTKPTLFILNALFENIVMLIATLFYMSVLMYSGSYAVALKFSAEFDSQAVGSISPCETFWSCLVYTINLGIQNR